MKASENIREQKWVIELQSEDGKLYEKTENAKIFKVVRTYHELCLGYSGQGKPTLPQKELGMHTFLRISLS